VLFFYHIWLFLRVNYKYAVLPVNIWKTQGLKLLNELKVEENVSVELISYAYGQYNGIN